MDASSVAVAAVAVGIAFSFVFVELRNQRPLAAEILELRRELSELKVAFAVLAVKVSHGEMAITSLSLALSQLEKGSFRLDAKAARLQADLSGMKRDASRNEHRLSDCESTGAILLERTDQISKEVFKPKKKWWGTIIPLSTEINISLLELCSKVKEWFKNP